MPAAAAYNTTVIDRRTLLTLMPHQGAMCLWDTVVGWDATGIRLRTASHARRDNPLRSHGLGDGRSPGEDMLRAVHLCEYGAQAMAAHGGLLARDAGDAAKAGMLVALRGVALHVARIDDLGGELDGEAELLAAGAGSQQYAFRILHAGRLLAEGRAAVILQD